MARDFTKNVANYLALTGRTGSILNGASAVSVAAWANVDTISSGVNDNRIFAVAIGTELTSLTFAIDGSGGTKVLRVGGRSQSGDSFQARNATSSFTTGTWHHCGGVWNISGDTITPYFNGAAENSGAVTFGASSYTHTWVSGSDFIGGAVKNGAPTVTSEQTDGRIAELAFWIGDIGAAGFAQLADGFSPLAVRPDILAVYFPLIGYQTSERDSFGGMSGTITGTVAKADHPRIIYPQRKRVIYIPAATTTFTASAAVTTGAATASGSATFTAPVYTASAAVSTAPATCSGSATFTAPVYTAAAAVTTGAATASGSATFTAPVYTASAAVSAAPATCSGSAQFNTVIRTASGGVSTGAATASGSGTFTAPVYTASSAVSSAPVTASGSATFTVAIYSGSGTVVTAPATASGAGTFSAGTKTAAAAVTTGAATCSGTATGGTVYEQYIISGVSLAPAYTVAGADIGTDYTISGMDISKELTISSEGIGA